MKGFLEKHSLVFSNTRYFQLNGTTLSYRDKPTGEVKGTIDLRQAAITFDEKSKKIKICGKGINKSRPNKDEYLLSTNSREHFVRWRGALRRAMATSPSNVIAYSDAFAELVSGFRGCVQRAVEQSVLDLSEYSENEFEALQRRHAANAQRVRRLRNLSGSSSSFPTPRGRGQPVTCADPLSTLDKTEPYECPDDSSLKNGSSLDFLDELCNNPAMSDASAPRRSEHRSPVLKLPSTTAIPKPGTSTRTSLATCRGPTWHYLDLLNHCGGLMSTVQYQPGKDELVEIWNKYAGAVPGHITQPEHSAIVRHLVLQIESTLRPLFTDIVSTILRAYGFKDSGEQARTLMRQCAPAIDSVVSKFSVNIQVELPQIESDLWSALNASNSGLVPLEEFLQLYSSRSVLPSTAFLDVTLDEIAAQIQQMLVARDLQCHRFQRSDTPLNSDSPQMGDCGLTNLGNTCYMNAVLQCLVHTPRLRQHVLLETHREVSAHPTPLCDALCALTRIVFDGATRHTSPGTVRTAVNALTGDFFAGTQQHDAQEWLVAVLDGLHEELNTAPRSSGSEPALPDKPTKPEPELAAAWWDAYLRKNESLIVSLFHGQLRQQITCSGCGSSSLCFDPFVTLIVPIPAPDHADSSDPHEKQVPPVSFARCLDAFFADETLSGENQLTCSDCKNKCSFTKQVQLWRPPHYLICVLKRFKHDRTGQIAEKITTPVNIPMRWSPRSWMHREASLDILTPNLTTPSPLYAAGGNISPEELLTPLDENTAWALKVNPLVGGKSAAPGTTAETFAAVVPPLSLAEESGDFPWLRPGAPTESDDDVMDAAQQPPQQLCKSGEYRLFGVVQHRGWLHGGHYVACVENNGRWVLCNDSVVSVAKDVPKQLEAGDETAYALFYRWCRSSTS